MKNKQAVARMKRVVINGKYGYWANATGFVMYYRTAKIIKY